MKLGKKTGFYKLAMQTSLLFIWSWGLKEVMYENSQFAQPVFIEHH